MILFIAAPLVNAVRISFFKWNGYSQNMRWYGLKNFVNLFTDNLFWRATLNTMIYGFGSTFFQNVCGLAAALFLNNKFKGRNGVRVILYMPIMISAFIMGQILYYFVQAEGGVFNELLGIIGISPIYWMKTGLSSTLMIMLANSWQYMGLCMIIYLAGLQNIPGDYYEVAELEKITILQKFRYITVPLLKPTTLFVTIITIINSFQVFDQVVIMTGGGPARHSSVLVHYIYQNAFKFYNMGYACALGWVLAAIIFILTLIMFVINGRSDG